MIYDEETGRHYLNEFHMQNSKGVLESLKKQKSLSREEMIAQFKRFQENYPDNKYESTIAQDGNSVVKTVMVE